MRMTTEKRVEYVPVPVTGRGSVSELAGALYNLCQHAEMPEWVKGAARELCRDYHVQMQRVER